jgi:hypothetical protein
MPCSIIQSLFLNFTDENAFLDSELTPAKNTLMSPRRPAALSDPQQTLNDRTFGHWTWWSNREVDDLLHRSVLLLSDQMSQEKRYL